MKNPQRYVHKPLPRRRFAKYKEILHDSCVAEKFLLDFYLGGSISFVLIAQILPLEEGLQ